MILNLKKPRGLTSHDVVARVRRIFGEKKVGHGGTLDPLAEGVLIIGVGRESTKKLHTLLKETDKEYVATIELGKTSTTDDAEGEITETGASIKDLSQTQIETALQSFRGKLKQTPPSHSAVKVGGTPSYKLAREGRAQPLQPREIEIKDIELIGFSLPAIKIRTIVSSGTYIRSLARDIGETLGVGGYLQGLIRTRVGDFKLEDGLTLEELSITCKKFNNYSNEA